MDVSISNVINISVAEAGVGIGAYNTSNTALFTDEEPGAGFGSNGYKIYLGPSEVGVDFGTSSKTYLMAVAAFSQQPNLKQGSGYLVVVPMVVQKWTLDPASAPTSGAYSFTYDSVNSASIDYDATEAEIQAIVRAVPGLEKAKVEGTLATAIVITGYGTYGDLDGEITENANTLDDGSAVAVTITDTTTGESADAAITRTKGIIQYFAIMFNRIFEEAPMLAAAALVQTLNKIAAFVSVTEADIESGGMIDKLRTGAYSQSRGLYYGASTELEGLQMMAAYVGRGFSVNFSGSNTTQTMHLKTLRTIQPDPTMTETILAKALAAGADTYISIEGVPKVFSSGLNEFFDYIYNLRWFVGDLEVAGFNILAQLSTKIPQTEGGMLSLKSGYRDVCKQAVTNQFLAPGEWNSPETFGNQVDFYNNIRQFGYYIYSTPISQQSKADREARKAPLCQIAIKTAGAMHSSDVIVNINK